jgi:hypothetical protein
MPDDVASIDDGEWSAVGPEGVESEWWLEAKPLCFRCAAPIDRLQHYCHNCEAAVGQLTPLIPFVNIPMACEPFCIMWERLWFPRGESRARRATYLALLIIGGMVSGYVWILPIALVCWWRRPPRRPGCCHLCGYGLRASPERCPECGAITPVELGPSADALLLLS